MRPPTGPIKVPNPGWEASSSPFFFEQQARPWGAGAGERHAGVSAFGFGGTNFHAVLSAYDGAPEPVFGVDEWPAELFCFRGVDGPAAAVAIDKLAGNVTGSVSVASTYTNQYAVAANKLEGFTKKLPLPSGLLGPALLLRAAAGPG